MLVLLLPFSELVLISALFGLLLLFQLDTAILTYGCSIGSCNRLGYRLGEGQMSL